MVRIHVGPQSSWSQANVKSTVDTWATNHSEWASDTRSHTIVPESADPTDSTAPEWWTGDYRLTKQDTQDTIMQDLVNALRNNPDWFRVAYHECTHDEIDSSQCPPLSQWSTREWTSGNTTIPPEVPDYT